MNELDIEPKKHCSKCNLDKPHSAFNKDRTKSDGLHTRCRDCRNAASRQRAEERREAAQEPARARLLGLKKPENREEEIRAMANLLALKRLAEQFPREFQILVGEERSRLGYQPRWVKAG